MVFSSAVSFHDPLTLIYNFEKKKKKKKYNKTDQHAALTSRSCGGAVDSTAHAQTLHFTRIRF
ncbi:unnamed protein product, partial [Ixodes persulcatus]